MYFQVMISSSSGVFILLYWQRNFICITRKFVKKCVISKGYWLACSSGQSDGCLCCQHKASVNPMLSIKETPMNLTKLNRGNKCPISSLIRKSWRFSSQCSWYKKLFHTSGSVFIIETSLDKHLQKFKQVLIFWYKIASDNNFLYFIAPDEKEQHG